jgi:MOSC domain
MAQLLGEFDTIRAWKAGWMSGLVEAVSQRSTHSFSKQPNMWIRLLAGLGVEGDAHLGATVKHRSRVARDPMQPNLRQVHLLHRELLEALAVQGFVIGPGDIGENILTRDIDLLGLPTGTVLRIGPTAEVRITGLRNPCIQLDRFQPGLMAATLDRDAEGNLIRKAGVMAVVLIGGEVRFGDAIQVVLPPQPHRRLIPV